MRSALAAVLVCLLWLLLAPKLPVGNEGTEPEDEDDDEDD